ncbi:MAG: glycosyltransferase family A protein [Candidatus Aenigmatarchaeota archaeon]
MIDISVIIPTYNKKNMLIGLIKALRNQDYPKKNYEIIVVDDGSNDGTEELVKSIKTTNTIYIKQINSGPAEARNKGIKIARGKIITFIDDDCIPSSSWLKSIKSKFVNKVVAVEGKTVTNGRLYPDSHYIKNESGGMYVTCNMAFRASEIRKGFDKKYRYPNREDSDLAFSLLKNGGKIIFSEGTVVNHRLGKNSIKSMMRKKFYFESDVLLFKKYPKLYKKYIKFPSDLFAPLYFLFTILSIVNIFSLLGIIIAGLIEIKYRKYAFSTESFVKLLIVQTIGSFVNVFVVAAGCIKYRVNPLRFFSILT